jgi:hypothetical protein
MAPSTQQMSQILRPRNELLQNPTTKWRLYSLCDHTLMSFASMIRYSCRARCRPIIQKYVLPVLVHASSDSSNALLVQNSVQGVFDMNGTKVEKRNITRPAVLLARQSLPQLRAPPKNPRARA